jgi:hypothetical protein
MVKDKVVKYTTFPDQLASNSEKAKEEYGLQYAMAIQYEWYHRPDSSVCRFLDKRDKYHKLRLYARGEQSSDIYKQLIAGNHEESYTNYDWRPLQIVPKFVNLQANQMLERLYDIKVEATDKFSTDLKEAYKQNLEKNMVAKDLLKDSKDMLGVDLFPQDAEEMPENKEEVDLYMQLKYKAAVEIASEQAIRLTLNLNNYEETQSKVLRDIIELGIGGVHHYTDPVKGIVVEYLDPADCVYSYPENNDFDKVHYYGRARRITINELKRISGKTFTKDELRKFAGQVSAYSSYQNESNTFNSYRSEDEIEGIMVDVLDFTFKTVNTVTYKKKYLKNGGYKMIEKDETFDKPNKDYKGYDVVKKQIDVWYKGSIVLGTDMLFNYGMCENMIRPKGNINKTLPDFIFYAPEIYQNRTIGMVERMITYVDQMQQVHIKIQQLIAKARPNGIFVDIHGINEVDLGNGNYLEPLEIIRIYNETGNVIGTSISDDGGMNSGRVPIQELRNTSLNGIPELINTYNYYLNLLRDAIGIPAGADASAPDPDTLVGVQQQVTLNSNVANRHISKSVINITERLCTALSLRIKDIFKYSELKEVYLNSIGQSNIKVIESLNDLHLHDFGITISLKPDQQEKQQLEANINIALSKEEITLDDAIDLRNINNIKIANELLKIRRKRRLREKREHELNVIKENANAGAEAAERSSQARIQEMQFELEKEIQLANLKTENRIREIGAEKEAKSELIAQEFGYNLQLSGIEVEGKKQDTKFKEDEKLRRQDINNTQQSELIDQRKKDSGPKRFESREDSITGGLDLGEIGR